MPVKIDVMVTEPFMNNHPGPNSKRHEIIDKIEEEWGKWIEDSNGNYIGYVRQVSPNEAQIPASELPSTTLSDRVHKADNYIENAAQNIASDADMILVIDYFGGGDYPGVSTDWGNAGKDYRNNEITATVDTWWEDNNELDPVSANVRSEGIAFHEVLHQFDMYHSDCSALQRSRWDRYSIDCPPDGNPECSDAGDPFYQGFETSDCSTSTVRNHIDNNI